MTRDLALRAAVALALVAQLWTWQQVTRDTGTLAWAAVMVAVVQGSGVLLDRLGMGRLQLGWPTTAAIQTAVAAAGLLAGVGLRFGWDAALNPVRLALTGAERIIGGSAPLPPHPGLMFLLAAAVVIAALIADWLVIGAGHPAAAAAPIFALYAVPAVGLATPMLFTEFAAAAAGYLLVLAAGAASGGAVRLVTVAATTTAVAVAALGVTWLVARQLPELRAPESAAPLQMSDPSLDLKRNLVQGSTDVVLRHRSEAGADYLKLATMPRFSVDGFGLQDVRVATGRLPGPPGLTGGRGTPRVTDIEVGAFASEWLPVPFVPTGFDAAGEWGFALDTLDVMALQSDNRGRATSDLDYQVRSLDIRPGAEEIAAASTSANGHEAHLDLVPQLPARVAELAEEITAEAPTAGAKALAIEEYLTSDRFTYSLASTSTGDGLATIDDFLFRSRSGYCEQFAGSMAIMARAVGIPSRLAVGFVPGTLDEATGWYEVTARDLHTWPELWLDGWGWVAFEPTPARGLPTVVEGGTAAPTVTVAPTAETTPTPTAEATPTPTAAPGQPSGGPGAGAGDLWWAWLLVLVALAGGGWWLAPLLGRRYRRWERLRPNPDARAATIAAWDEIRDTVLHARMRWPSGSPRYAAERLAPRLAGDAEAQESLHRLALAAERALFDRPDAFAAADGPTPADDARRVVTAFEARSASGGTRRPPGAARRG